MIISLFVFKILLSYSITYLSMRNKNELRYYTNYGNTFFEILTIFLNLPVCILPRTAIIRRIFAVYMIFAFIFAISYRSCLISNLTNPFFIEKYSTLTAIYENKLKTNFASGYSFLFSNIEEISNVSASKIKSNWNICKNISECLRSVAFTKDSSIWLPKTYYHYYSNKETKQNTFCLTGSKINYGINMVMRKGFPLFQPINAIISKLISGGFISKWKIECHYYTEKIRTVESKKVKLEELRFVFQVYFFVLLFYVVILITEIVFHINTKRNINQ